MDLDIRQSANSWGEVILSEAIAIVELAAEENGMISEPRVQHSLIELRSLVGASNREEFLKLLETTWGLVGAGALSSPFKRANYDRVVADLKRAITEEDFDDRYAESLLLGAEEEDFLTQRDVDLWKLQLDEQEDFSKTLKMLIIKRGIEKVAEDIGSTPAYIQKKVDGMDMTMSELRLICLVLEILVDYKLVPHDEIDTDEKTQKISVTDESDFPPAA